MSFDLRRRWEMRMGLTIRQRNAQAKIANVPDPRPERAMAQLEEHHPDEADALKRTLRGEPACWECGGDPSDPRHPEGHQVEAPRRGRRSWRRPLGGHVGPIQRGWPRLERRRTRYGTARRWRARDGSLHRGRIGAARASR